MAQSGIERIDKLFAGAPGAVEIVEGDADKDAVRAVQDLLNGHEEGLPDVRELTPDVKDPKYGKFDRRTLAHLKRFRLKHGLQGKNDPAKVDTPTLKRLVNEPARYPRASRPYVTLALDVAFTGMMRVLSGVALGEGAGKFTAINKGRRDLQGLSYGIIQWAQKQERLDDIVTAFKARQPQRFRLTFGPDGDGMVEHVKKKRGGLTEGGETPEADKKFDLVERWTQRFIDAGRDRELQKVQIEVALANFRELAADVRRFAPLIRTERGFAFMIDLANQHGSAGAESIFKAVFKEGNSEKTALEEMSKESVTRSVNNHKLRLKKLVESGKMTEEQSKRNEKEFERGVTVRRKFFRTTPFFSDSDFNEN